MNDKRRVDGRLTLPAEAMRALRQQFRASGARTVEGLRSLAAQLAASPSAADVIDTVRRELHRVRGTAGSYGYHDVSRLAGELEARVVQWAADPLADHGQRAALIEAFAGTLETELGACT